MPDTLNFPSRFLKILIAILTISFVTVLGYYFLYNAFLKAILYHVIIITTSLLLLVVLGWLLMSLSRHRYMQYVYGSIWGAWYTVLIVAYLLVFNGILMVGLPLSIQIFWAYLHQFNDTARSLNVSLWLAYPVALALPAMCIGLFVSQSKFLWHGSAWLLNEVKKFIHNKSTGVVRFKWGLLITLLPLTAYQAYKINKVPLLLRFHTMREPLSLVFVEQRVLGVSLYGYSESASVRDTYPTNLKFDRKNVILIIVDALRADHLSLYGYPENTSPWLLDLHKRGHLRKVDYAFSATSMSFGGILCTLRSKTWPKLADFNFSLPDLLKRQGYKSHFILAGDHTNFYNLKYLFGKSWDTYFDGTTAKGYYYNDDRLLFEGFKKIPVYANSPSFFYFHMMSVHQMGARQPANIRYRPADATNPNAVTYRNHYKNGIVQVDQYIHRIFDELDAKGYLQNSLVVITADHGELIGENNLYGHGKNVSNKQIHIPLLIYDTDSLARYRSDHAVQADIAATIVDRLGLPIPTTWAGKSLLRESGYTFSYHSQEHDFAVIQYQPGKILKYYYNADTGAESVYNLSVDPEEKQNILSRLPNETMSVLKHEMKRYMAECKVAS